MKKKRSIPYGYTMKNGKLIIDDHEAEVIKRIFDEYRSGMSMYEMAMELVRETIPYCEKKVSWNKNVIARIIANEKYAGAEGYIPIIGITEFREAQACKNERTKKQLIKSDSDIGMIRAKMICSECESRMKRIYEPRNKESTKWCCCNDNCRSVVKIDDTLLMVRIQEKMNFLIDNPEMITSDETYENDSNDTPDYIKDEKEIKRLCETNNYTDKYLITEIISMAEKRYDSYGASDTEVTIALRHAYEKAKPTETFNAELFLQTVRLVLMDKDGNITICLNNNIEV